MRKPSRGWFMAEPVQVTPWRVLSHGMADHPGWSDDQRRQSRYLNAMPLDRLRALWDDYDGCNEPDGWDGEAIWLALNMVGDGGYCAV